MVGRLRKLVAVNDCDLVENGPVQGLGRPLDRPCSTNNDCVLAFVRQSDLPMTPEPLGLAFDWIFGTDRL